MVFWLSTLIYGLIREQTNPKDPLGHHAYAYQELF